MQRNRQRTTTTSRCSGVLAASLGLLAGCNGGPHEPRVVGSEVIELRMTGQLQRPPVAFDHAKHTTALVADGKASPAKDKCGACHGKTADGKLAHGVVDGKLARAEAMNAYHALCVDCHRQRAKDGKATGPAACGDCHAANNKLPAKVVRRAARYDYSLHARHVVALDKKCEACHKKDGQDVQATLAKREAAHRLCIDCHGARADKGQTTGPVLCRGCHDPASHAAYRKLPADKIPRIKVSELPGKRDDQPDKAMIQSKGTTMAAVPFKHEAHEPRAGFCSTCHHKTTAKGCDSCHTLEGKADGGGVTLEGAHHHATAGRSCVGCHQQQTQKKDCAGCHHALNETPSPRGCKHCHSGAVGPHRGAVATTAPASQPPTMPGSQPVAKAAPQGLPATGDDFPEEVVIKSLQREYQPSKLPHRKIVEALYKAANKSKLAKHFHGNARRGAMGTLCAGCHHHSPTGQRPPSCASCHGDEAHATKDKPRLLAAYHRQCIGCHQKMKIKAGCTDCHARKGK